LIRKPLLIPLQPPVNSNLAVFGHDIIQICRRKRHLTSLAKGKGKRINEFSSAVK
jgi:hypothetical protein